MSKIPVLISAGTDLGMQSVRIGDAVRVRGVTQSGGTVMAEHLDFLPAGIPLPDVEDDHSPAAGQEKPEDKQQPQNSGEDGSGEESGGGAPGQEATKSLQPESKIHEFSRDGVVQLL